MRFRLSLLSACLLLNAALGSLAQDVPRPTVTVATDHFPLGSVALADSVIDYRPRLADLGLDAPAPASQDTLPGYILEDGGWITWLFTDNLLANDAGPDLEVLGDWPQGGVMHAWISRDEVHFLSLGVLPPSERQWDIAAAARPGQFYTAVKLRYTAPPSGETARVLGVAALNGPASFVIPSQRLFDGRSADPLPSADETLTPVADFIRGLSPSRITVEGYLDPQGAEDYLLALSQQQADTVSTHLKALTRLDPLRFAAIGMGAGGETGLDLAESELEALRRIRILVTPQREIVKPEGQCP